MADTVPSPRNSQAKGGNEHHYLPPAAMINDVYKCAWLWQWRGSYWDQRGLSRRGFLWRIKIKDKEADGNRRASSKHWQHVHQARDRVMHGIPGHEARVVGVAGDGRAREQKMRLERQVGAKRWTTDCVLRWSHLYYLPLSEFYRNPNIVALE